MLEETIPRLIYICEDVGQSFILGTLSQLPKSIYQDRKRPINYILTKSIRNGGVYAKHSLIFHGIRETIPVNNLTASVLAGCFDKMYLGPKLAMKNGVIGTASSFVYGKITNIVKSMFS